MGQERNSEKAMIMDMNEGKWRSSSIYSVDAVSGEFETIYLSQGSDNAESRSEDWDSFVSFCAENIVEPEYSGSYIDFCRLAGLKEYFRNVGPVRSFRFPRRESGGMSWCRAEASVSELDENGETKRFLMTFSDITEKIERKKVRSEEQKFHDILERGIRRSHDTQFIVDIERDECYFIISGDAVSSSLPQGVRIKNISRVSSDIIKSIRKKKSDEDRADISGYEIQRLFYKIFNNELIEGEVEEIDYKRVIDRKERWFRLFASAVDMNENGRAKYIVVSIIDVTKVVRDRKKLEEAAKRSEEKLKREMQVLRSFKNIFDLMIYIDLKTGEVVPITKTQAYITAKNDNKDLNAHDPEFLIKYIKPDSVAGFRKFFDIHTAGTRLKRLKVLTTKFEGCDNEWYRAIMLPVDKDEDGNIAHVLYTILNITSDVQQEKKFLSQLKSLTNAYESCVYHDLETGEFTLINGNPPEDVNRVRKGGDPDKVLGSMLKGKPGESRKKHFIQDKDTLREMMAHRNIMSRECRRSDGKWFAEEIIGAERNEDGTIRSVMMTTRDISKKKNRENTTNALSAAIGRTYIGLYHYDLVNDVCKLIKADISMGTNIPENTIATAVARFESEMFTPEVIMANRDFWDFSTIAQRLEGKEIISREILTRKHGWVEFSMVAYKRDEHEKLTDVLMMTREIDSEKKLQLQQSEELRRANEAAQAAAQSKAIFLSNMSHDIRTPMNAIVGFAGIAAAHIRETDRVRDCIEKIQSSSEHLMRLINDVLDMSHIESGQIDIKEEECIIADIIHGIVPIIRPQAIEKNHNFKSKIVNVRHEHVLTDASKISRVLVNLLSNAVKYTKPGGSVMLRVEESECPIRDHALYTFTVSDTGQGMSKELIKRVFQPFERASTSTQSGVEGMGLGLTISKNIIDKMGGDLNVESRMGQGTTITIKLEIKLNDSYVDDRNFDKYHGMRALIVDPEKESRDNVTALLREIGLRTEQAFSAGEVGILASMAKDSGDPYSVYVIDEELKDESPTALITKLHDEVGLESTAVILTSFDHTKIYDEAKRAGVTDFCDKPVFMSDLDEALGRSVTETVVPIKEIQPEEAISSIRLLVVDDNDLNREIDDVVLSEVGFMVETACDGKEAVEMLESSEPGYFNLVLMDIQMPVMDGYEATRQIRRLDRKDLSDIPIVAMSANAFEEDKRLSAEAGMNYHISKPIDVKLTVETILKYAAM